MLKSWQEIGIKQLWSSFILITALTNMSIILNDPCSIFPFQSSKMFTMTVMMICFVVWSTDEKRLILFPAGITVRDPHYRESPTRCEKDLDLRRT